MRFLCVPNIMRDLRQSCFRVRFCPCQIECETCIQSYLTYAILCVPNRLRDLKSILLYMCVFCACQIECETWGNLTWHVCFLSMLNRVQHLKSILLDMSVFCSCPKEYETWSIIDDIWITQWCVGQNQRSYAVIFLSPAFKLCSSRILSLSFPWKEIHVNS